MTTEEGFDTGGDPGSDAQFVLDLDGYEGPIDVLLTLARDQSRSRPRWRLEVGERVGVIAKAACSRSHIELGRN